MKTITAIKILKQHQAWLSGDGEVEMGDSEIISMAIDVSIKAIENTNALKNKIKARTLDENDFLDEVLGKWNE